MDKIKLFWHWLGDFCLRLILLVGMSIVFGAGVYMSWHHTTDMAIRFGTPLSHAVAYTWFVETLLVASEIVVLFQATRRQKPHTSVFVGVAFGAIINLASNVSSYWPSLIPAKIGGILMGATIPAGTAIAIWIFATTLTQQTAKTRQSNDKTATDDATKDLDRQVGIINKLKTMGIVGRTLVKTLDAKTTDRRSDSDKTTADKQSINRQQDNQTVDTTTTDRQQTDKTTADKQSIDRQQDNQTVDNTTDATATKATDSKTTRQTVKKQLSLIKGSKTDNSDDVARQKALDYYQQTGKFPSYRQLGEMANISKDKAGRIIKALKQKIS